METNTYPINPHSTLRPLLLCLATAAASKRAPPALIPLLTPINKQRVKLLASEEDTTWLRLLSSRASGQWDRLIEIVSRDEYEPHPASGEIELSFVPTPQYHRSDAETLKAKITLPDLELTVIYLWCDDADPGPERIPDKWRVHEILPGAPQDKESRWEFTLDKAEDSFRESALEGGESSSEKVVESDDYWDQYDRTPGETSPKRPTSIAEPFPGQFRFATSPDRLTDGQQAKHIEQQEQDYYKQYDEVQPALDNDVQHPQSSGTMMQREQADPQQIMYSGAAVATRVRDAKLGPLTVVNRSPGEVDEDSETDEAQASSHTTAKTSIERLENSATFQSQVEFGIRQHVGSNVRSMFNLCRSTGMGRADFEDLVKTELASLSMYDQDY